MNKGQHNRTVIDQFTKQAGHFAKLSGHEEADSLLLSITAPPPATDVPDVACGPGLVACAFATLVRHVTGIDMTPAMIERAKSLQAARGISSVSWDIGDVNTMPYTDNSFDVALTRYSVHHFMRPQLVLGEMARVVKPGGRVVIADLVLPASKSALYDSIERRRDPSHVHVVSEDDLLELAVRAGLTGIKWASYRFELSLDTLMGGSFPNPADATAVRQAFEADADLDLLGVGLTKRDGQVWLAYPVAVVAGTVQ